MKDEKEVVPAAGRVDRLAVDGAPVPVTGDAEERIDFVMHVPHKDPDDISLSQEEFDAATPGVVLDHLDALRLKITGGAKIKAFSVDRPLERIDGVSGRPFPDDPITYTITIIPKK